MRTVKTCFDTLLKLPVSFEEKMTSRSNCSSSQMNHSSCSNGTGNSGGQTWKVRPEAIVVLLILYTIVLIVGIVGNIVVLYVVGIKRKMKRSSDYFMLSLAVADFLASFFIPFVTFGDLHTNFGKWHFGDFGCKVLPAFYPLTITASGWSLVLISLDRYRYDV